VLGMAVNPRFRENRKYYLARHVAEDGKFATLILEREAAPDLKSDSGKPSRLLLKIEEATNVHHGGGLEFGPDGYLRAKNPRPRRKGLGSLRNQIYSRPRGQYHRIIAA
jgi:glucose/arabinose dehydrogenase